MRLLTTAEAAEYLRLKERKIYELVAENAIPCTKITGKWLFPKDELDHWLRTGLKLAKGMKRATPLPIVGGSHDPLLEWALRESGSGLAGLQEGSEAGLDRFNSGEITAAAIHLHIPCDSGQPSGNGKDEPDANVVAVSNRYGFFDSVLIAFARREQGIVTAANNPLGIKTPADLVAHRPRVLVRQDGAGAQLLLVSLLRKSDIGIDQLNISLPVCATGNDIAQAIHAGRGDCGIATRSVATSSGLHFVPLLWEHFDLAVRQSEYFKTPFQKLMRFCRTETFKARARELGGYNVENVGEVRLAP